MFTSIFLSPWGLWDLTFLIDHLHRVVSSMQVCRNVLKSMLVIFYRTILEWFLAKTAIHAFEPANQSLGLLQFEWTSEFFFAERRLLGRASNVYHGNHSVLSSAPNKTNLFNNWNILLTLTTVLEFKRKLKHIKTEIKLHKVSLLSGPHFASAKKVADETTRIFRHLQICSPSNETTNVKSALFKSSLCK